MNNDWLNRDVIGKAIWGLNFGDSPSILAYFYAFLDFSIRNGLISGVEPGGLP